MPPGRPRKYPLADDPLAHVPGALVADPVTAEREDVLKDLAEDYGGWVEKDCSIGWEYFWREGDSEFRYYVSGETVGIRIEQNSEFYGGNQYFQSRFRGPVLVDTTDPREKHKIEPDPGPEVEVIGGSGQCVTMKVSEFLELINKNNAKRRNMAGKR